MKPFPPRLTVGCDIDDVLANFIKRFMEIAGKRYGVDSTIRPASWEWDLPQGGKLSREIIDGVWDEIQDTYNFWQTLDTEPGVMVSLVRQIDARTKLIFPTARAWSQGDDVGKQTASWIEDTFGIWHPSVIVSDKKAEMAKAMKYDYFIDDRPKNVLEVKAVLPDCKVYLCDASHNQSFNLETNGIPRISGFNEFAEMILAHLEERCLKQE